MAIQNRRGQAVDFVPSKMLPGEFAVSLDNRKLYMCFASGTVKEVALTDDVTQAISTASTSLGGRIAVLESASTEQGATLLALVTRMGTAEAAIRSHDGRLVVLENDGTNIKARLSDVESETATLDELLTDLNLNMITISNDVEGLKSNAVRFDTVQNKSAAQKLQARENTDSAGIASLATAYSPSARYAVGDMVTYDGKLYTCKTAITTAEAWNNSHWTEVTVGDRLSDLKDDLERLEEQIEDISLSEEVKVALLNCFQNVGWKNKESRETYYNALYDALYPDAGVVSISATYNQGSDIVYTDDPLDNLKAYLTVIATYSTGRTKQITDYALIGTLAEGTNTITVTYSGKTTTFTMTAVDFYNIWEWDSRFTGVGQLMRIGAKCTDFTYDGEAAKGVLYYDGDVSGNKSRSFAVLRGKAPMVLNTDRTQTSDFYPIPIPPTAGKITATVTPNTQRLALYLFRYDPANQTIAPYKRFSTISWNVGSQTITFTPESNLFFCFNCSVDASFSSYTVEPEMNVVFE